jgi:hypothetical protein
MILRFTKVILPVVLLILGSKLSFAQAVKDNPITTAVPFLRLSADARTAAMGDVGVATNPDANSAFYNGAKTAFNVNKFGIGATYTPYLHDLEIKNLYQLALAGYYKFDENQALSFGVRNFSQGEFFFTDDNGQDVKSFRPQDLAAEIGYSRKLSDKFGIGLNARYIYSKLASNVGTNSTYKNGSAVAADISAFYKLKSGWNFGLAFTNLGSKMDYGNTKSYIPANIALGTSYNTSLNEDNKLTFAFEANKLLVPTPPDPTDITKVNDYANQGVVSSWFKSYGDAPGGGKEELREVQLGLGSEYSYKDQFFLRAGYFYENKLKGNRNYATAGAGFMYKSTGLNLSYLIPTGNNTNNNALKNTFRLSLLFGCKNATTSK